MNRYPLSPLLTQRCTILRPLLDKTNPYGHKPRLSLSTLSSQVPCWYWESSADRLELDKDNALEIHKGLVSLGKATDIRVNDIFGEIRQRNGTLLKENLEIISMMRRDWYNVVRVTVIDSQEVLEALSDARSRWAVSESNKVIVGVQ